MIKKLFIAFFMLAATLGASAQLVRGEKSLGVKIGYASENSAPVAGLTFQYAFSSHLRIAPELGCAFRHHDKDALLVDLNLHVPFGLTEGGKVLLYPLAGLAFNSWNKHRDSIIDQDADVTTHVNRFGVNLGAGFDLRCTETLKLNLEAKYTLVKSYSSAYITAGISYMF